MADSPQLALLRATEAYSRSLRESAAAIMRDVDTSRARATVIRILAGAPRGVGEIAQILRVDTSVASRQVSLLVDEGLVERTIDPHDRRARQLQLTDAGRLRAEAIEAHLVEKAAAMFADWTDDELRDGAALLRRLVETLDCHAHPLAAPHTP